MHILLHAMVSLNCASIIGFLTHQSSDVVWFDFVPSLVQISDAIRDGAEGFFRTQYGTISKMALILAFVILGIYLFRTTTPQQEASGLGRWFVCHYLKPYLYLYMFISCCHVDISRISWLHRATLAYITVASFLLGALCSGIAGFVGMWVSVRANVRVSSAARRSAREALQVWFSFLDALGVCPSTIEF